MDFAGQRCIHDEGHGCLHEDPDGVVWGPGIDVTRYSHGGRLDTLRAECARLSGVGCTSVAIDQVMSIIGERN